MAQQNIYDNDAFYDNFKGLRDSDVNFSTKIFRINYHDLQKAFCQQ